MEHIESYADHLAALIMDMSTRFRDMLDMKVDQWMVDPFIGSACEAEIDCQEELVEL